MNTSVLYIALFAISVFTTLTVQGIKVVLDSQAADYSSNVLAIITSLLLSVSFTVGYLIMTETAFNIKIAVQLIALMYLSFLVATNGYDKVKQAITQIMGE